MLPYGTLECASYSRFDLDYWGLDYPPLTAYVSWACGQLSRMVDPASMSLGLSRGYEAPSHKVRNNSADGGVPVAFEPPRAPAPCEPFVHTNTVDLFP